MTGGREISKVAAPVEQVEGNEVLTRVVAEGIEKNECKWNDLANNWLMTQKFFSNLNYHEKVKFYYYYTGVYNYLFNSEDYYKSKSV